MIGKAVSCKLHCRRSGSYCRYNSYLSKRFEGRIGTRVLYIGTSACRILAREPRGKSVHVSLISKSNVRMGFELVYEKTNGCIGNMYEEVSSFMASYFLESTFISVLVKYILYWCIF